MSEVLDEDSNYANGAEEGSYFGEVFARAPVDDFVDSRRIGNVAFRCDNNDFLPENVPPQYFIRWTMRLRF